jgi:hypothetical protein
VGLFKRKNQKVYKKMLTQSEFNIIYEFLDRVPLKGHNERTALNSVIIKLQKSTIQDSRQNEDNGRRESDN